MPEQGAPSTVCCFVLGTPAVRAAGGDRIEITADKPRRLLAELLLHRDSWVETDALAEALWAGEQPPQSARGNLKTYVHQLRRSLPPGADGSARLESRRGSYRLVAARHEVDACVFEDLVSGGRDALGRGDAGDAVRAQRRALELWRGRPFTQVPSAAAEAEAARLDELRRVALDCLGDALVSAGRPAEAVTVLTGLTAEEPLREGSWRRLLVALRADGRQADALHAYERVRTLLADELGASPGPELAELHRQLLAEPPPETEPAPEPAPAPAEPRPVRAGPVPPVPQPPAAPPRRALVAAGAVIGVLVVALAAVGFAFDGDTGNGARSRTVSAAAEVDGYPAAAGERRPVPGYPAAGSASPALLFGMGDQADTARESELVRSSRVGMLTTWYDGRADLETFRAWRTGIVPRAYREGKALHLIVGTWPDQGKGSGAMQTRYGRACGQYYPLTDQFLDDMRSLARSFAGSAAGPPLYVSVYNGMEKLACDPEGYKAGELNTAYYRAVQDRYLKVVKIFHHYAPNARVGLNWEGWQATSDHPDTGDGRSMFGYFARELRASDFVSFSAYEPGNTAQDIRDSVAALHRFGLPIMLSHYEPYTPDGADPAAATREFDADLRSLFAPASIRELTRDGLFAWSFKRPRLLQRSPASYRSAADVVARYGREWYGGR